MRIRNMESLLSHGNTEKRKPALEILETGLEASDPYRSAVKIMHLDGDKLIFDPKELDPSSREPVKVYDLSKYNNIYVFGGGKAVQRMAKAIEDTLGDRITEGHVNAKKGEGAYLKRIGVTMAGHPMPDNDSVEGAQRILKIAGKVRKSDLVIYPMSGGVSACTGCPPPGVPLEDLNETVRLLYFERGAPIWDLNVVREIVSSIRGGRIEKLMEQADVISTATDENWPRGRMTRLFQVLTYEGAANVIKKYGLWSEIPRTVREYLERAEPALGPIQPDELNAIKSRWYTITFMNGDYMLRGAKAKAEEIGVNAAILTHRLSTEVSYVSNVMTSVAAEIEDYGRPFKPPCALLSGGELIVTVGKATGRGGRNQEFALTSAQYIQGSERIVVAAADSDGTDGPTDAAGGVVDGYTMDRVKELGIDVHAELANHNSYHVLKALDDSVVTGAQGTNVQDLRVVYVSER